MCKAKKYLCLLTAILAVGTYSAVPAFASPVVEWDDEDTDTIVTVEDEEEPEEDDEDNIEFIDDSDESEEESIINLDDPDGQGEETDAVAVMDPPDEGEVDLDEPDLISSGDNTPIPDIPPYTAVNAYTMYANDTVNVRYGPDTSYSKAGTVYLNQPVTVVGYSGGWLAIKYNGTTGFVSSSFFSQTAPETTTSTTAAETTAPETEDTSATEAQAAEIVDTTTQDTAPAIVEPDESETTAAEDEPDTTRKTEKEDEEPEAASVTENNNGGGLTGILIALGCALGAFVLLGVVPVLIHKIHHNKLYQY